MSRPCFLVENVRMILFAGPPRNLGGIAEGEWVESPAL